MEHSKNRLEIKPLLITLVCAGVLGLWAVYRILLGPLVIKSTGSIAALVIETAVKCLIFILPALALLFMQRDNAYAPAKKLFTLNRKTVLYGVGLSAAFLAIYIVKRLIENGHFSFQFSMSFDTILTTIIFAGVTEEIFFRGWLFNTLRKRMGFIGADLISAGVFVLSHYPIWYTNGYFSDMTFLSNSVSTLVIGLLLGYVMEQSKSIWGPMFAHSMHNLIVTVLF